MAKKLTLKASRSDGAGKVVDFFNLAIDLPAKVAFVPGTDTYQSSIGKAYLTISRSAERQAPDTVAQTVERVSSDLSLAVRNYLAEESSLTEIPDTVEWRVEPVAYVSDDEQRVNARCRLGVVKWRHNDEPLTEKVS